MGVDIEFVNLLQHCQDRGLKLGHTATLGRQHFFLSNFEVRRMLAKRGKKSYDYPLMFLGRPRYSESFWTFAGSTGLSSIDASDFEGADVVHDLNVPLPEDSNLRGGFDTVVDIGTMEHIFNIPVALQNCIDLVRIGGNLVFYTPVNNLFGHGFYQLSPELFASVFQRKHNLHLLKMVLVQYSPIRRRFVVSSPAELRRRVTLINAWPTHLFVWATKTGPSVKLNVQQSDYEQAWKHVQHNEKASWTDQLRWTVLDYVPWIPRLLEAFVYSRFNRRFSLRNSAFTPIKLP